MPQTTLKCNRQTHAEIVYVWIDSVESFWADLSDVDLFNAFLSDCRSAGLTVRLAPNIPNCIFVCTGRFRRDAEVL